MKIAVNETENACGTSRRTSESRRIRNAARLRVRRGHGIVFKTRRVIGVASSLLSPVKLLRIRYLPTSSQTPFVSSQCCVHVQHWPDLSVAAKVALKSPSDSQTYKTTTKPLHVLLEDLAFDEEPLSRSYSLIDTWGPVAPLGTAAERIGLKAPRQGSTLVQFPTWSHVAVCTLCCGTHCASCCLLEK